MGTNLHRSSGHQRPKLFSDARMSSSRLYVLQSRSLGLDLFLLSIEDNLHGELGWVWELPRADKHGAKRAEGVDPCFVSVLIRCFLSNLP